MCKGKHICLYNLKTAFFKFIYTADIGWFFYFFSLLVSCFLIGVILSNIFGLVFAGLRWGRLEALEHHLPSHNPPQPPTTPPYLPSLSRTIWIIHNRHTQLTIYFATTFRYNWNFYLKWWNVRLKLFNVLNVLSEMFVLYCKFTQRQRQAVNIYPVIFV